MIIEITIDDGDFKIMGERFTDPELQIQSFVAGLVNQYTKAYVRDTLAEKLEKGEPVPQTKQEIVDAIQDKIDAIETPK